MVGERLPIRTTVLIPPNINDGITLTNCDEDGVADGFTQFDLTQYLDLLSTEDGNFAAISVNLGLFRRLCNGWSNGGTEVE